jgi:hypothetical protein
MRDKLATSNLLQRALLGIGAASLLGVTGCQSTHGGQTLPSPYYLRDDVQYHQPGPEFKLAREAAAQKAFQQDAATAAGPVPGPAVPVPPGAGAPVPPPPGPAVPPPPAPGDAGANLGAPRFY